MKLFHFTTATAYRVIIVHALCSEKTPTFVFLHNS